MNVVAMSEPRKRYPDIGARLMALRLAFGGDLTQGEWADAHGFNRTQYSNWETGERRITVDYAEVLTDRYEVTLDWIYRNKMGGLSETSLKRLREHLAK